MRLGVELFLSFIMKNRTKEEFVILEDSHHYVQKKKRKKAMTQTQIIAFGFFIMITIGTILLMLPISSKSGTWTSPINALFTATSASCVTGLVVFDTYSHWTIFGQIVLILLIQIGGLGFMTIATLFSLLLRRKIGLKERELMQESVSTLHIGGVVKLTKKILLGTLIFEGTGAVFLAFRFIPMFGVWEGIYNAIFHSISAFCNAGFDLMGRFEQYSSFCRFSGDPLVNLVLMSLIIIGGIGYLVWDDISIYRKNVRRYRLHTKIVLSVTAVLIFGSAILFYCFEREKLFADMNFGEKVLASFFSAVTPRTAGFNTVDTAALSESSKILTMLLMFIGGSPGSTAGGIKTTTVLVLLAFAFTEMKHEQGCNIFGRRLEEESIRRANAIVMINFTLVLITVLILCHWEKFSIGDAAFEAFSAMGTAGMSTGVTRELSKVSRILISFLMYCGRVGSLSFALAFTARKPAPPVQQPQEKITVG